MTRTNGFRLAALQAALERARRGRGLSWAQVAREIHRGPPQSRAPRLSPSTLAGVGRRSSAEADGVLQMLLWLDRTPESFVPGHPGADAPEARLPQPPRGRILRFDTARLHAALDAKRIARGLPWAAVAREIGVSVSSLQGLSRGGRTSFPQVMRLAAWLESPAARWTRAADR